MSCWNGDNIVLCGNERLRVGLELGLQKVSIVYWKNGNSINQKIGIIRDNLARKAVDFRTKLKCYQELKSLHARKQGGDRRSKDFKSSKGVLKFSDDELAKEVGFSVQTLERATKIEKSKLP